MSQCLCRLESPFLSGDVMTTLFSETVTCDVCGTENEISAIGSTNAFGSPDLDLRPPEMQRSTMSFWVNECKGCGYVAADLSEESDVGMRDIDDANREIRKEFPSAPSLARQFLQVARWAKSDYGRAMQLLHAAWAFDDAKQSANAKKARIEAAISFQAAMPKEDAEDQPSLRALLTDVQRRSGDFSAGIETANSLLRDPTADDTLRQVASFQLSKCTAKDDACYTVADAVA